LSITLLTGMFYVFLKLWNMLLYVLCIFLLS